MCCINVRTQWKSRTKWSIRKTHYTYTEHMKCYTVESHICDWTWCQLLHFAIVGQYSQWRDVEQRGPPVLLLQQLKHIIYLAVFAAFIQCILKCPVNRNLLDWTERWRERETRKSGESSVLCGMDWWVCASSCQLIWMMNWSFYRLDWLSDTHTVFLTFSSTAFFWSLAANKLSVD